MSPETIAFLGLAAMAAMIVLRVPVAVALGLTGYCGYAALDGWDRAGLILGAAPAELASACTFPVAPLFTLMGAAATAAGLSRDLFAAANACLRGTKGSLAIAAIFASGMFGAICGSSVATALTMSRVSIPEMLRHGYPGALAAGAVAAGGTLGILIPPSLILMIYAIVAQLSVSALFAAALIPGVALMLLYALCARVLARGGAPQAAENPAAAPLALIPAPARIRHVVLLFGVTIGGIYRGWFTPTEAAAVGALGALLLGLLTGRVGLRAAADAGLETVRLVGAVIFIVMASTVFSYFIVQSRVSGAVVEGVQGMGLGPTGIILALCAVYIVMGCFLEGIAMILITVPIAPPLVLASGFDPVWFGVLLVILIEIGLITPPLGMNLFVIKAVSPKLRITEVYRGAAPFLAAPLLLISAMIAWPEAVLWPPSMIG